MLDLVRLYLKAGDGGDGKVAFFRSKRILKGGPDGGNGGDGGDIILQVDRGLNTLQHFSGRKQFVAESGMVGGRARKTGRRGEDIVLPVPYGTVVWLYRENKISGERRRRYGVSGVMKRDDWEREKFFVQKETETPRAREREEIAVEERVNFESFLGKKIEHEESEYSILEDNKLLKIAVMDENVQKIVVCQGGIGGRGNNTFKSASNTTPLEAEYGTFGEEKVIFLELRLLANIGLVGYPNVGKSSLLADLTSARPKVANYPFTTLEPNLGVMVLDKERSLVVADIPGLIEGASEGKGLGFTFLRHVHNSRALVYVVALSEEEVVKAETVTAKAERIWRQYVAVGEEVKTYSADLKWKRKLIVVNKSDLYDADLREAIAKRFAREGEKMILVSAATREGLTQFKEELGRW